MLASLPEGVFSELTSLETLSLEQNKLASLPEGVFSGLTSLTGLSLIGNKLVTLPAGVFSGLSDLDQLWLGYNELRVLPAGVFSGLTNLNLLQLISNQLTTLSASVFSGLTNLRILDLSANWLNAYPAGVFSGLTNLNWLDLTPYSDVPVRIALQLERVVNTTRQTVQVRFPQGAPFPITVFLSVDPASGARLSTTQVTIPIGTTTSSPVALSAGTKVVSGVTVSMMSGNLPEETSDQDGSYRGFIITDSQTLQIAPLAFVDGASTTLYVAENVAENSTLVGTVIATGGDGQLRYGLEGNVEGSEVFEVDDRSGDVFVRAGASLNHETRSSYTLTMSVSDELGASTMITLMINVGDVDEPPPAPALTTVTAVVAESLTVSWSRVADTEDRPPVSSYIVAYRLTDAEDVVSSTRVRVDAAMTSYVITGLLRGTAYRVAVIAKNEEGESAPSSAKKSVTLPNHAPIVVVTGEVTVAAGGVVELDGSGSYDPDGDKLSYEWFQASAVEGIDLGATHLSSLQFTAPERSVELIIGLRVADDYDEASGIVIESRVMVVNTSPTADVSNTKDTVVIGQRVTLDGGTSSDGESNRSSLTYSWTHEPSAGQTMVDVTEGDEPWLATFKAPAQATTLRFVLKVTDPGGLSDSTAITIRVLEGLRLRIKVLLEGAMPPVP